MPFLNAFQCSDMYSLYCTFFFFIAFTLKMSSFVVAFFSSSSVANVAYCLVFEIFFLLRFFISERKKINRAMRYAGKFAVAYIQTLYTRGMYTTMTMLMMMMMRWRKWQCTKTSSKITRAVLQEIYEDNVVRYKVRRVESCI